MKTLISSLLRIWNNVQYRNNAKPHSLKSPMPENHISGVVVNVLAVVALSVVDRGFEFLSAQAKENNIGMCCFFAKNAVYGEKDWLARNQDNVSE
jgi:hypothetical protein